MTVIPFVPYVYGSAAHALLAPGRTPLPVLDSFIPYVTIPDETNSGCDESLLTGTYSGPTTITTANTTISNQIINSRLIIQAANVTVNNCLVQSIGTSGQQMQIDCRPLSCTGFSAYRSTFRPISLNFYTNSIMGHDWLIDRCVVDKTVDGWSPLNQVGAGMVKTANAEVRFSMLKQLAWYDDDGGIHADGTHNDGMQIHNGSFVRVHGNALHCYKYNVLGTPPLDESANNRYPQIGQDVLVQHVVGYIPGEQSGERTLTIDSDGFPIIGTWGGAPLIDHNWIWGGDNGIKSMSAVNFGSLDGQHVDLAMWVLSNTWMDYPRVYSTNPYPIRICTNTYLNGTKYAATTGQGWTDLTSPSFDAGNRYSNDTSIPTARRGHSVGVRVDSVPASVARA